MTHSSCLGTLACRRYIHLPIWIMGIKNFRMCWSGLAWCWSGTACCKHSYSHILNFGAADQLLCVIECPGSHETILVWNLPVENLVALLLARCCCWRSTRLCIDEHGNRLSSVIERSLENCLSGIRHVIITIPCASHLEVCHLMVHWTWHANNRKYGHKYFSRSLL